MPGLIFILAVAISASGCFQTAPKGTGSFLIVVVPNLRADDIGCGTSADSFTPKLDAICNESVRFTHAYTTSALEIPALASILTGLYPVENGIHRNGSSLYLEGVKSLAQEARDRGLETFLVSGGVPLLRKTAVAKGFSAFDDSVRVGGSYYRSALDTVKKFLSVMHSLSEGASFFGVIDLADLEFPEIATNAGGGFVREGAYNGKIQKVDEAMGYLRDALKKEKIWDGLTVIVTGTQGSERSEHDGLSKGLNLFDEVVHVPLLIKPSRKPRDQGQSWKVDEPVNFVDLGVTLFHLMGIDDYKRSAFPVRDFSLALNAEDLQVEKRPLFVESDLPAWRGWGPRIVMMRYGEWAFWAPPEERLYNTYTDHMELRNLFSLDFRAFNLVNGVWTSAAPVFKPAPDETPPGTPKFLPVSIAEKLRATKTIFSQDADVSEKTDALNDLEMRRPGDWQIVQWHVGILVENHRWEALHEYLSKLRPSTAAELGDARLWDIFLRLKTHAKLKPEEMTDNPAAVNCLYLGVALKRFSLRELESVQNQQSCPDRETQDWVNAFIQFKLKKMKDAEAYFDMARNLTEKREDQTRFAQYFWLDGATWDYLPSLPAGPAVFDLFADLVSSGDFIDFVTKKQWP